MDDPGRYNITFRLSGNAVSSVSPVSTAASQTHGPEALRPGGDVSKLVRIGDHQYLTDLPPTGDHRQNTSGRTLWQSIYHTGLTVHDFDVHADVDRHGPGDRAKDEPGNVQCAVHRTQRGTGFSTTIRVQ